MSNLKSDATDAQLALWERWWTTADRAAGHIVWEADEADLLADLERFGSLFDRRLPVVDLGCGDGRQTRFLAQHFATVIGTEISPAAVRRAQDAANPANVRYRVLDARDVDGSTRLHDELGDANVYVRGVLQALPATDRPQAVQSIARLVGHAGTLFVKELPPAAGAYFANLAQRYGLPPALAQVMQLIPPGEISEQELVDLLSMHRCDVLTTGTSHMHTVTTLPNGEAMLVPAIYAVARPRR